jgi:hypothetical protein
MRRKGKGSARRQRAPAGNSTWLRAVAGGVGLSMIAAAALAACDGIVDRGAPDAAGCPTAGADEGPTLDDFPFHRRDGAGCPDAAITPDATTPEAAAPETSTPDAVAADVAAGDAVPEATVQDAGTPDASVGNDASVDDGSVTDTTINAGDAQDATPSEVGAPVDAAQDSAPGGSCTLSAGPSLPFIPLSGSANVTGTESVPGTQPSGLGGAGCFALTTNPSSGVLTFSMNAGATGPNGPQFASCSVSYAGFGSTIVGTSFDGDTYTCAETGNGGSSDKNQLCPEESNVNMGVGINMTLKVTRSTGAVSLVRNCTFAGSTCATGGFPSNATANGETTEFTVSGSLSCPTDAGTD